MHQLATWWDPTIASALIRVHWKQKQIRNRLTFQLWDFKGRRKGLPKRFVQRRLGPLPLFKTFFLGHRYIRQMTPEMFSPGVRPILGAVGVVRLCTSPLPQQPLQSGSCLCFQRSWEVGPEAGCCVRVGRSWKRSWRRDPHPGDHGAGGCGEEKNQRLKMDHKWPS